MIPSDNDGRLELAAPHHVVEFEPQPRALAVAQPANPRRQALKLHARPRQLDPAGERLVPRKRLEHRLVRAVNILRVARQSHPAKRTLPLAEEWPDVLRHKAGNAEGVLDPGVVRLRPDVVA